MPGDTFVFRRWKEYLPAIVVMNTRSQFPKTNLMQYFAQRFIVYGQGSALQIISFSKPVLINGVCDTYQLSAGEEISPLNHGQQWDNVLSSVVFPRQSSLSVIAICLAKHESSGSLI